VSELVIVDTDVVSFYVKADTRAKLYDDHLRRTDAAISFMTLAELEQWMLQHGWGAQRKRHLEQEISRYAVLAFDRDLCRWWATVRVECRKAGRSIDVGDAWIAATALLYDAPLLTHNPNDYAGVPGLTVLSANQ
jgi:predicted nucleic acid-binding protein